MGILGRFSDIISANINSALDSMEDPGKMCDQYIINATEDLLDIREKATEVIAEEKACKRACDENQKNIAKYDSLAREALKAGNEADAELFIAKKQQFEDEKEGLDKALAFSQENSAKMRELHEKMSNDLVTLKQRRAAVKTKEAVANTQKTINRYASCEDKANKVMGAFDRMERKTDRMIDKAEAEKELLDKPDMVVEAEKKYKTSDERVKQEINRLKGELKIA